jgi:GNAT superfamily N-acetyltransferase
MLESIVVEPMTEEFILWRCLHSGPLSGETIDQWRADSELPWESYRKRNLPLLIKLTRVYGACAIVARAGDQVVGMLRFYPKVVCEMAGAGGLCLQQDYPSGPAGDFANNRFPPPDQIQDRTLTVHCLMTGCARQKEHPHQRKGLGSLMVRTLIEWAKSRGWERIEAAAFEDLPIVYEITGSAGHTFWEKLGFSIVDRYPHPDLQEPGEFVSILEGQARAAGIPVGRARDKLVMRLDLASLAADVSGKDPGK